MSGVSAMPDGTVIVGTQQVARETLLDQGSRAATALDRLGVREGDAIALLIRNDSCYFEVLHAAALLGAYVVPLNWHSTADEIAYILSDCTPRALIGHADLIGKVSRAGHDDLHLGHDGTSQGRAPRADGAGADPEERGSAPRNLRH